MYTYLDRLHRLFKIRVLRGTGIVDYFNFLLLIELHDGPCTFLISPVAESLSGTVIRRIDPGALLDRQEDQFFHHSHDVLQKLILSILRTLQMHIYSDSVTVLTNKVGLTFKSRPIMCLAIGYLSHI